MTDETLRAIRERYRRIKYGNLDYTTAMQHDIPLLLQEIERLKGEVAQLGPFREFFEKIAKAIEESPAVETDWGLLRSENDRLEAESDELYETLRALVRSNLAYGYGTSEFFKADLDAAISLLLRLEIDPAEVEVPERPAAPDDPFAGIKITGYAAIDYNLHLFVDPEELRAVIMSRDFGQYGWIDRVVFHPAGPEARESGPEESP
jgi:hypothetical protein